MNGASSLRGYLLQTIICLFDALEINNPKWKSVVIEPNLASDKVDILWFYPKKKKVVQVKSSKNQIGKSQVKQWAEELQNSIHANEYELILLGPCSQVVIELDTFGHVKIPAPKNNDVRGLLDQASHKLDRYFEANKHRPTHASEKELIVASLVLRLEEYSTLSLGIQRTEFDTLIRQWRSVIYSKRKSGSDELDLMEYRKNKNLEEAAKIFDISTSILQDILAVMSSRYRFIIAAKYGLLLAGKKMTNEEIAVETSIPIRRIEELEKESLDRLKKDIRKQKMNAFTKIRDKTK